MNDSDLTIVIGLVGAVFTIAGVLSSLINSVNARHEALANRIRSLTADYRECGGYNVKEQINEQRLDDIQKQLTEFYSRYIDNQLAQYRLFQSVRWLTGPLLLLPPCGLKVWKAVAL